jgi:hypothetical protein
VDDDEVDDAVLALAERAVVAAETFANAMMWIAKTYAATAGFSPPADGA